MPDVDTVRSWQGATMVDRDGDRIGTIESIYVDDQTGQPEWALVNTGLFGTRSTFV
ncbi:MAG TPA: PRC-barrel domain-containing protein, partial [Actinomycetota bacterium]|nr:PRC-barrel domain-containing protein [Actinomycetota bacterium]